MCGECIRDRIRERPIKQPVIGQPPFRERLNDSFTSNTDMKKGKSPIVVHKSKFGMGDFVKYQCVHESDAGHKEPCCPPFVSPHDRILAKATE